MLIFFAKYLDSYITSQKTCLTLMKIIFFLLTQSTRKEYNDRMTLIPVYCSDVIYVDMNMLIRRGWEITCTYIRITNRSIVIFAAIQVEGRVVDVNFALCRLLSNTSLFNNDNNLNLIIIHMIVIVIIIILISIINNYNHCNSY